jgi:hypothetical protein
MKIDDAYAIAEKILGSCAVVMVERQRGRAFAGQLCTIGVQDGESMRVIASGRSWTEAIDEMRRAKRRR